MLISSKTLKALPNCNGITDPNELYYQMKKLHCDLLDLVPSSFILIYF